MLTRILPFVVAVAVLAPSDARAQVDNYAWYDDELPSGCGVSVTLGGGVAAFTESTMRDLVSQDLGWLWNLRVAFGTHVPLALEVGYSGTSTALQTLARLDNGTLLGTALEGTVRWNVLPHTAVTPFLFAGVGWQRYDVVDANFTTADTGMKNDDDLIAFPLGGGILIRSRGGLVVDFRGTFRRTADSSLVIQRNAENVPLHTWEASVAVGLEF